MEAGAVVAKLLWCVVLCGGSKNRNSCGSSNYSCYSGWASTSLYIILVAKAGGGGSSNSCGCGSGSAGMSGSW